LYFNVALRKQIRKDQQQNIKDATTTTTTTTTITTTTTTTTTKTLELKNSSV